MTITIEVSSHSNEDNNLVPYMNIEPVLDSTSSRLTHSQDILTSVDARLYPG